MGKKKILIIVGSILWIIGIVLLVYANIETFGVTSLIARPGIAETKELLSRHLLEIILCAINFIIGMICLFIGL